MKRLTSITILVVFVGTLAAGSNLQAATEFVIPFELDRPAQVSVAVYHNDGQRMIRTLLTGESLEAGEHTVVWDGLDRYGRAARPGQYRWKLLATPGFQSRYLTTIGTNPGTARWHDWVGNHAPPTSVACDGTRLHIGSMGENTPGGICMSLDGRTRFWDAGNRFAWSGVRAAQFVGGELVELHAHELKAEVFVVDPETGKKLRSFDVSPAKVPDNLTRIRVQMAVAGSEVAVTYPDLRVVRFFDVSTGKELRAIKDRAVTALAFDGQSLLTLEDGRIRTLDDPSWSSGVELTNPVRLACDSTADLLWVAEGEPSHRIVCISRKTDRVVRTLGREGGRAYGPWANTDFREINSICSDHDGGLFIAEGGAGLRRVVHVSGKGTVLNEWFGSQNFFNYSSPNPDDPTEVLFMAGYGTKAIAQVDYGSGRWKVVAEYHHPDFGGLFPKASHFSGQWQLVVRNGKRFAFCDRGSGPALFRLEDPTGEMIPIAAMGRVHWNPDAAPELWEAAVAAKGLELRTAPKTWKWRDDNGNGNVEADELRLLDIPLGGSRTAFLDEASNLWLGRNDAEAAWFRIDNRGPSDRPDWDVENPHAGAGRLPEPLRDFPGIEGRGIWIGENGSVYRQLHANSNPAYNRPNRGWPTCYHGTSRLLKWSADGELQWEIGRHAVRAPGNLFHPSDHHEFHDFTRILGVYRGCVIVGDRVVRPATAWTSDGLYAGDFFDRRPDDGLPDCVYTWWRDRRTNEDGPVPYDVLTGGSIYPVDVDRLLWFPMGEQNTPVFEVTGWTDWHRDEGFLTVSETPRHAKAAGTGLRARYAFSDGSVLERVDRILWFQGRRESDYYLSWDWNSEVAKRAGGDSFTATWEGMLEAPLSEPFTFSVMNHRPDNPVSGEYWHPEWGSVRVWLGGQLILDQTDPTELGVHNRPKLFPESRPLELQAGARYPIRVEYSRVVPDSDSLAEFALLWDSPTQERQRIPTQFLYPDKAPDLPVVALQPSGEINAAEGELVKLPERRVSISGDGADDVVWTESGLRIRRDENIEGTEVAVVSLKLSDEYLADADRSQLVIRIEDEQLTVPDGRELHYLFTRDDQRTVRDVSDYGRHLQLQGVLDWTEDGSGLVMDGNAARVRAEVVSNTVSVAIRFRTDKPDAGLMWAKSQRGGMAMFLDEGILQVKDGYANPVTCQTAANLADGRFHQVVWSLHRSTGAFEVFVDGRLCQSQTSERSRATHPLTELLIGGAYGGGPFRRFVGAMDDFRIYSRPLSAEEAAALTP